MSNDDNDFADNCLISAHALIRWEERRPGKDIRTYLRAARRNTYHPMAARAIASYGGISSDRYFLATVNGEVFVMAYKGTVQHVVTVLIPENVIKVDQFADTGDMDGMSREELIKALEIVDLRKRDLQHIMKQLNNSRSSIERLMTTKRKRGKKNSKDTLRGMADIRNVINERELAIPNRVNAPSEQDIEMIRRRLTNVHIEMRKHEKGSDIRAHLVALKIDLEDRITAMCGTKRQRKKGRDGMESFIIEACKRHMSVEDFGLAVDEGRRNFDADRALTESKENAR